MTSKFEDKSAENQQLAQWISKQLDESNENLSEQQLSNIAQARNKALRLLNEKSQLSGDDKRHGSWLKQILTFRALAYAAPAVFLAITVTMLSLNQESVIQTLPIELVNAEMPVEDLAMLEDLEFATWLAENSQEDVL